ncbi:hypothetical protein [Providencia sp. PROV108]|uniref:hypothetical protein n=1 Tax=Providencia sp. PROV108 TaxID=2949820 RepID=UPI0023499C8D|nr:hypothetical protein [Providencia sp. PROV108]
MQGTNPTDFEKWCAKELGVTPESIMAGRVKMPDTNIPYMSNSISKMYRAWVAGANSSQPLPPMPDGE